MLLFHNYLRAPFIAPGRRNRKVHWNRPLHRAVNSLGKFEKEDWRRALWLPESLRQFYPRWNNQFSPGGGSGCGCCDGSGILCPNCTSDTTDTYQVDLGTFSNDECTNCADYDNTSWIVTRGVFTGGFPADCTYGYTTGGSTACAETSIRLRMNGGGASDLLTLTIPDNIPQTGGFIAWIGGSTNNDCGNWNLHEFVFSSNTSNACDSTGDSCFVTAL